MSHLRFSNIFPMTCTRMQWTFLYIFPWTYLWGFLQGAYLRFELQGHWIYASLTSLYIASVFSKVVVSKLHSHCVSVSFCCVINHSLTHWLIRLLFIISHNSLDWQPIILGWWAWLGLDFLGWLYSDVQLLSCDSWTAGKAGAFLYMASHRSVGQLQLLHMEAERTNLGNKKGQILMNRRISSLCFHHVYKSAIGQNKSYDEAQIQRLEKYTPPLDSGVAKLHGKGSSIQKWEK